jgi:VCBS repeat-containing protein
VTDPASGESLTRTVNITVNPVADLTADDDSATTREDTPVTGTVAGNDSTTSGGTLTFAKASDPEHGSVLVNGDGTYTYTPDANYNGPDSFTYTVTDPASGESLTQTVTITVTPVNDAPTAKGAIADRISEDAQSDTSFNVASYFSDVDGDTLTYGASGLPTGLTIDPTTGIISGTIDHSASQGGAAGVYNVTVTATSSDGGSVNQTFTWTVTNPAPVANDDAATTNEDTAVSGNVLSSGGPGDVADSDPDGDPLRVTGFTVAGDPTPHGAGDTVIIAGVGTLTLDVDGAYSFTPTADWNGTVPTVTYTVSDDEGGTDTADLVITVAPVADLTAADDSTTTPEDTSVNDTVAGNDSTTSGGTLTFAKASDPEHGSVIVNGDGTYTYTPDANYNGPDSFTYTVTDPASGESLTQTVTITVNPVNDAPVIAGGDQSGAVTEAGNLDDGTVVAGDPDASGSFTASDVDGDALTWSVAGTPDTTYGTFSIDAATGAWSYALDNTLPATQALNEGDTVSLTYDAQVSDGNGGTATRSVTITITGTNDSPVANGDTATVTESGVLGGGNTPTAGIPSVTDNVLTNDTDVDDGEKASLTVSEVSFGGSAGTIGAALTGTYGSLVLNSDGGYTYTLDNDDPDTQPLKQGDTATEVFTYTAVDVNGATTTSTLTITVTGTNDRPVITSTTTDATGDVTEAGTTVAGVPTAAGTLTASDVDTGATQTWSLATTNGTYGTIDIDPATGEWTYTLDDTRPATQTLNDGDTGTETFTARVTDEFGAYSEQVVTITVHGSNDDLAGTGNATVSLAEDGSASGTLQDYVSDVDDTLKVTGFTVDADGDGTDESHAPGDTVTIMDADGNTLGTLTIAEDGDYSFTPAANYAGGAPTVTYTMVESGGAASVIQTLDFEIAKVADAPDLEADKTVSTNEDTAVSLGLIAPVITDTGTGTTNNDFAERLGAITLTIGGAGASGVTLSTGAMTLTPVAGEVTIVLTDSNHVPGVPAEDNANGVYYLTTAQYQALEAHPLAESGADFTVTVGATSYEVDSAGAIVPGVAGATSTQTIAVDVLAVTDGASLASSATASDLIFAEDETIDLSPYLTATLTSGDANPGNDTDGSETYWYTVSDLPNGTVVTIDGVATIISAAVPTATSVMSASATPPTITITPPANYSGDIDDVTITLNTQDTDGDSSGTIATITSSVTLDLHVTPVAGDVSAGCLVALWQAR